MTNDRHDDVQLTELTEQELERHDAEQLPDREAMSLINANIAIPVNAAVAANVLADNATAYANAEQDAIIDQATGPETNGTP